MRIRFMQTTPSACPDAPFQAGQVIEAPSLTHEIRAWIKEGSAIVLPEAPEAAMVGSSERAVQPRAKARTA